ncbi:unnamed protein product [Closterium sp. Naga37s-1]|nr:unnamed protein product [Closterium sp. Naga37s-1]
MFIRLQKRLFLQSHVTISGRGANVIIRGGMVLQNITNVIIHNVATPLSPPPLSPPPLSPPPLSPPPLSTPPLSPPPLSPPPLSPPPLSPPPLSPPPDTPIRAVGDQRGDHDVAHNEMSEPKNPPPLLPLTVLLKCPHPPIHNSLPRLNTNLTMLLGTEDDGVYDVDMRVTRVINLTMLLGAEDDGVYDVDMRVTLYRNWFDKSGQRQPKARWGRVHGRIMDGREGMEWWWDGWTFEVPQRTEAERRGVNGCRDGSWMEGKGWSGGGMDGVMDGERQWNGRLGGEMEAWRDG